MPCGKRPLVKKWDKCKNIKHIKPSRYEQNEASVKVHWRNVVKALELSYQDDQFWESQSETVRELVGNTIFQRIIKIFDLPRDEAKYEAQDEMPSTTMSTDEYYLLPRIDGIVSAKRQDSMSTSMFNVDEEEVMEEESTLVTTSSNPTLSQKRSQGETRSKVNMHPSLQRLLSSPFSKTRAISGTISRPSSGTFKSEDTSPFTDDDLCVHPSVVLNTRRSRKRRATNPHFDMLYCNESETDMIKWDSHYKQKAFEVSASDEFSKRAEILTKQIAKDFFDWWVSLGNVEFKSEIKKAEDIESLFQVWFDEHASRGLVLNPKIIPCVLKSIAKYTANFRVACQSALARQIDYDIHAETSPAHVMAFGTSLPHKMKHIPPKNNTKQSWHTVRIPEELRTMSFVWGEIDHLTSTKQFRSWLKRHPHLPIPPCFMTVEAPSDKKGAMVTPSDFVLKEARSQDELALPVSQFSLELKEVLSKLMNQ